MAPWLALLAALTAPAPALTWRDCAEEALKGSPALEASRRSVEAARSAVGGARSRRLPQASLSARQSRDDDGNDSMSAGAGASLSLFSGWDVTSSVRRAQAGLRRAEADYRLSSALARSELRRAFGRLLSAQQTLELSRTIARRLKTNAEFIRLRYEGGVEAGWGWLKAKADAEEADWEASRAELDLRAARRRLLEALGRADFAELAAEGTLEAPGPGALEEALGKAAEHPRAVSERESLEESRWSVVSARSGRWPSLDLSADYSRSGDTWSLGNDGWSVAGALRYPLFTGGRVSADVHSAFQRRLQAEARLEDVRQSVAAGIESAYASYRASTARVAIAQAQLRAGSERAETVEALYANGRASFLDWDQAQTSLTSLQRSELSARLGAYLGLADWEEALGVPLEAP